MNHVFDRHYEAAFKQQQVLKENLAAIDKKIDGLEADYYVEKRIPAETYDWLRTKLAGEKKQIMESLAATE